MTATISGSRLVIVQTRAMAGRSILGIIREPQVWVPSMVFPLFFAALNTATLGQSTRLPGFPEVDSFLDFMLPATIIQGVMFGAISSGTAMATDVENGFFERLVASPVSRVSILLGRLAGAAVLAALQVLIFVSIFLAFGASIKGGLAGFVALALTASLFGLALGGLTTAMGLRTGTAEAVQGSFPLIFVMLFMSSAFFPASLMNGWFRAVAENNPLTWMIDAVRRLVITGFTFSDVAMAFAVPSVITVLAVALSVRALQRRLDTGGISRRQARTIGADSTAALPGRARAAIAPSTSAIIDAPPAPGSTLTELGGLLDELAALDEPELPPEPDPPPEVDPDRPLEVDPDPVPDPEFEPHPDPKPEVDPIPDTVPEVDPTPEAEPELDPTPDTIPEIDPDEPAEPEPDPKPEPGTAVAPPAGSSWVPSAPSRAREAQRAPRPIAADEDPVPIRSAAEVRVAARDAASERHPAVPLIVVAAAAVTAGAWWLWRRFRH